MSTEPIAWQTNGGSPVREPLMTASTYEAAVEAVDALADAEFPVERVTIVGHGISTVETITGRYGWTRALGTGALNGGLIGLFFGLLFDWWGALTPSTAWGWLALWGMAYGVVLGALVGLILYAFSGGARRDFSSARSLEADRYELQLEGDGRDQALRILRQAGVPAPASS